MYSGTEAGIGRAHAMISLDLDNVWTYLKTHGDSGWQDFPSYLDLVADLVLERCQRHALRLTVFVVGQDAALDRNREALQRIAEAGHEVANHSFSHEPWFHQYPPQRVEEEICRAEEQIERVTGRRPRGYRGPGFSLTRQTLEVLARRGYCYDATTFPTFLGPLARAYYFLRSPRFRGAEAEQRKLLFGSAREGWRQLRPYLWNLGEGRELLEIPVTTMPLFRVPIHQSYLLFLASRSRRLALGYLRRALELCRLRRVEPSFLLHPLDFLGGDREQRLGFFPAMQLATEQKLELFDLVLAELRRHFELENLLTCAERLLARGGLPVQEAR